MKVERRKIFFDVTIGGQNAERIVIKVFAGSKPNTAINFRALCTGEKGVGKREKSLHYKGSSFYKDITEFMDQGKDFTANNEEGGASINKLNFANENFKIKHLGRGDLS